MSKERLRCPTPTNSQTTPTERIEQNRQKKDNGRSSIKSWSGILQTIRNTTNNVPGCGSNADGNAVNKH